MSSINPLTVLQAIVVVQRLLQMINTAIVNGRTELPIRLEDLGNPDRSALDALNEAIARDEANDEAIGVGGTD